MNIRMRGAMVLLVSLVVFCLCGAPGYAAAYRVGGTWSQTGTGTIDGAAYHDEGVFSVSSTIDNSAVEHITRFSASGTYSQGLFSDDYSYTITREDVGGELLVLDNHIRMVYNGLTYDLTLLDEDHLVLSVTGTESSTGRLWDVEYEATKQSSSSGGSGGGCSLAGVPALGIFLLPMLYVLRK